jgi:hypothetical protein
MEKKSRRLIPLVWPVSVVSGVAVCGFLLIQNLK